MENAALATRLTCDSPGGRLSNYLPAGHEPRDPYLFPLAADVLGDLEPHADHDRRVRPVARRGHRLRRAAGGAGVDVEHIHVERSDAWLSLARPGRPKAGALIDRLADSLAARATAVWPVAIVLKRYGYRRSRLARFAVSHAPRLLCVARDVALYRPTPRAPRRALRR